jgi:hypothetical protein
MKMTIAFDILRSRRITTAKRKTMDYLSFETDMNTAVKQASCFLISYVKFVCRC